MKINTPWFYLLLSLLMVGCQPKEPAEQQPPLLNYVDPFIGTGYATTESALAHSEGVSEAKGQTYPAVGRPNGMTHWSPQTRASEKKCLPPYYYQDSLLQGFRATHWMSGSCTQDYGSFTLMPMVQEVVWKAAERAVPFSHENEQANPAQYRLELPNQDIAVNMTGHLRSGMLQIDFGENGEGILVIEPNSDEGEGYVRVDVEKNEIVGYNPVHRIYQGWGQPTGFSGHFAIQFDRPIQAFGCWRGDSLFQNLPEIYGLGKASGAFVKFDLQENPVVQVRAGTSFTSEEKARLNLEREIAHWDFEQLKTETEQVWEETLGQIQVETQREEDKTVFYTALYHSRILPRLFSDADGTYPQFDGADNILTADGFNYYADFSMWDTYRAVHPLLTILEPEMTADMIQSLVSKAEAGNWLPIFPAWNSYTAAMIGDHVTSMIGDAYLKGITDFDQEKAYFYMRKNAFEPNTDIESYRDGKGRRALESYLQYGYIPLEDSVWDAFHKREQASRTLEYAYDDFVLSQVAEKLGKTKDAQALKKRARNYQNAIDPVTGYARGRYADGSWYQEFDPNASRAPFITEGSPNQYTWYVPHDVAGLIGLMGGREVFLQKLDSLFDMGYYWHGNEPGHQTIYLYNYAGVPHKAQKWARYTMQTEYGTGPGGLSGNEDAGQMSAWFVFSAMGFYPVSPGQPIYVIGSPLFEKTTLRLSNGNTFEVIAENNQPDNPYIQSAMLNGKPLNRTWIAHKELVNGGKLELEMGTKPSNWGTGPEAAPPSLSSPNSDN